MTTPTRIHTAMVLAAGMGSRLRPLTDTMPKPLINVGGKPAILRTLEMLAAAGITHVVINTHYLAHMLETAVRAGAPAGMTIHFSYEEELLETGGGIKKALPLLGEDPILVVNSDAVWLDDVKPLLKPLMAAFDGDKHDALLAVVSKKETKDFLPLGDFKLDKKTKELGRVPPRDKWDVVYAGVHVTKPGLFMGIAETKFSLNLVWDDLRATKRLHGWLYTGGWRETGTHQGLELARAFVAGR
ncbi:MAG: nucleotidyltransferase family protein [Blastochloris viridis]|uniref:Nucleotidyltransferase family protein n=1 Tax=Blastochloris viridis TaxID=1079 RepID=A0A6N4R5T4_BLAVI|nr:MAG: nucleotidyltransferase family protein [Blastochloris viridis]